MKRRETKEENFIDMRDWKPARLGASSLLRKGVNLMETVGEYLLT